MAGYFHSVTLDSQRCKGCTTCITRCPTEAIRVRKGKARIITERCIDCGVCINVCPSHAKTALADPLEILERFRFRVALPPPSLFGQFPETVSTRAILSGFLELGFHDVFEVAVSADHVSQAVAGLLGRSDCPRPLISSSCPAVVRLIQVRFPSLIGHIAPVESPMEAAAQYVKTKLHPGVEGVGCFFITPCPAKVTSVRSRINGDSSSVDGVVPIQSIYYPLRAAVDRASVHGVPASPGVPGSSPAGASASGPAFSPAASVRSRATAAGLSWAISEGESSAVGCPLSVSVDGIHQVIRLLEDVENGRLPDVEFIEAMACQGGCVGGPLQAVNPSSARSRVKRRASGLTAADSEPSPSAPSPGGAAPLPPFDPETLRRKGMLSSSAALSLNGDLARAMEMLEELERLEATLPGLDCGSCGAPSCRALAEDVVKGSADQTDCVFVLREKIRDLTLEMVKLEARMPPSLGSTKRKHRKTK